MTAIPVCVCVLGWEERGVREQRGALAVQSVYTCWSEDQGLQDVRQGHNTHDAAGLVYHHQPVHLGGDRKS